MADWKALRIKTDFQTAGKRALRKQMASQKAG